ncbi:Glucose-induced degradation protein 4 -like protein [Ceratocystis fimbriata CBS 114723]|uniref:Glucose-induced degradation protein 4-like protein n=1 Tax=Ceratocystis fimbriata CBS 114723 TaxID=1035309 RepID=A0A2C5WU52_9PEZI|nr:Glucose-induced degradation protein 4 -like protein [Ceratocystis fimbriata CBS 114723]
MPTNNSLSTPPAPDSMLSRSWGCPDDTTHDYSQDSGENTASVTGSAATSTSDTASASVSASSARTNADPAVDPPPSFAPNFSPSHPSPSAYSSPTNLVPASASTLTSESPTEPPSESTPEPVSAMPSFPVSSPLTLETEQSFSVSSASPDQPINLSSPTSSTTTSSTDTVQPPGRGSGDIDHSESRPSDLGSIEDLAVEMERDDEHGPQEVIEHEATYLSYPVGAGFPSLRTQPIIPSPYLRPGTRYHGTQQAERQIYDVHVDIKYVDMAESYLCGYLRIQGLTPDHPKLTTFFEGEIIGPKYSFITDHESWGATQQIDLNHWGKFAVFRPYYRAMRKGVMPALENLPKDYIFMRWKEHFLVPDHTVKSITGASFEGFYYICFNISLGQINGIYFHARSEKFQQLHLQHIDNGGYCSSLELR